MPSYFVGAYRRLAWRARPWTFQPVRQARPRVDALEPRRLLSGGYTYEQLASFTSGDTTGTAPQGQLAVDKSGNLFGFTSSGGANGTGAAFEVQQGNSTPILIASFPAAASESSFVATGPVLDANDDIFGVTEEGGDANGDGTVFEIAASTSTVTTLADFSSSTTGNSPGGNLIINSAGDLFGTTANGGADGCGTVWELPAGSSSITALASFTPITVNNVSQNPGANGIAMDSSGDLFGTTSGNASVGSYGTLWELPSGTGLITTSIIFNGTNGATPVGGLVVDSSGNLFGVTEYGGDNLGSSTDPEGSGVLYELPAGTGQIAVLNNFDSPNNGQFPIGGVVMDSKGDLFGTTSVGGDLSASSAGDGTIWELPAQTSTGNAISEFTGTNGSTPRGTLVTDALGNVYGTASSGGTGLGGVVFKMDYAGASTSAAALTPTVVKSTVSPNVAAGTSAHGTATVDLKNSTSISVRGAFTISIYASTDGSIDSSATKVGAVTRTVQVPRDGTTAVTISVPSFPTATAGTYTLLAQVADSAGDISNATSGVSIQVAPAVIALSESFTRSTLSSNLVSGGKVRANVTIKISNSGNVKSIGAVKVSLGLLAANSTVPVPLASVDPHLAMAAGRSTTVTVPVTSIPTGLDGSYTLVANVTDPKGGTSSTSSSTSLTVSPPTVTLHAAINSVHPTSITPGSAAHGTISVTITNDGNIPVGSINGSSGFDINIALASQDGTQVATIGSFTRAMVLNPGQSRTLLLAFTTDTLSSVAGGTYFPTLSATVAGTSYSATITGTQAITIT